MLAEVLLEITVAVPKQTFLSLGNGIFHQKVLLFYDDDGCVVGAAAHPCASKPPLQAVN